MSAFAKYPKEPYIGVDCSGQPKSPPLIAVATRNSRRGRQHKWVARVTKKRINIYRKRYGDWQEKLYAALFFKVIDRILQQGYEIHICMKQNLHIITFGFIGLISTEQKTPTIGYLVIAFL
ncbi:hypothetical protein HXY33_01665 [Candidatus Bathyarchaeota archaeon]|nr:hypothetical protein [Candidatus Bathyarchaeota archaeon]